ncbi:MAG: ATP synthase F0 subunit C [Acidobacteria bacterium]|jgi:F-type H+-transporting ATPase subunit c|nr:ATP synthase F0 subunit C [Acidobacteriota bacterium]
MFGKMFVLAIVLMAFATPMMAADPAIVITSAFSMAIASGLCALGQGKAIAGAVEAIARNPGAATVIRGLGLLGLVFIESLALFTLVIVFVKG